MEICLDNDVIDDLECIAIDENTTSNQLVNNMVKEYTENSSLLMKTIICNDFSLHMLNEDCTLKFSKMSLTRFNNILDYGNFSTCIGDENIAKIFGLEYNKGHIDIDDETRLIVIKSINGEVSDDIEDIESEFEFYEIKYDKRCL